MVAISALTLVLQVVVHQHLQRKTNEPRATHHRSLPVRKKRKPIGAAPEVSEDADVRLASKFSNLFSWSP